MFPKLAPRAATGLKLTANGTALTVDRAASASASASAATATPVQVDTYFHLVVTRDHSKGYTLAVRNAMFANQVSIVMLLPPSPSLSLPYPAPCYPFLIQIPLLFSLMPFRPKPSTTPTPPTTSTSPCTRPRTTSATTGPPTPPPRT